MNAWSPRKTEAQRFVLSFCMIACGVAWGLVELFALHRSRYRAWRAGLGPPYEQGPGPAP
jgi:hypothetical protein